MLTEEVVGCGKLLSGVSRLKVPPNCEMENGGEAAVGMPLLSLKRTQQLPALEEIVEVDVVFKIVLPS
jgi:hypothetical protein